MKIGSFERPWNAKELRGKRVNLAAGIPPAQLWASSSGGVGQVGCIYTAQGFEFDRVGVIFGCDIMFDEASGRWIAHPERSQDSKVKRSGDRYLQLVQQTYRVLMSRGILGCTVFFLDPGTRRHFESRLAESRRVSN